MDFFPIRSQTGSNKKGEKKTALSIEQIFTRQ